MAKSPFLCYSYHTFSYNLHFNQQNGVTKQNTNHISHYTPTTTCFNTKVPSSHGLLKTKDRMSNT